MMTGKPYIKTFSDNGDYSLSVELTKHGQKTFGCVDFLIINRSTACTELATIECYDPIYGNQVIECRPGEECESLEELFDHPGDALEYIFARRQELSNPREAA